VDKRTIRIWDRAEGRMKSQDFYMDEFEDKHLFAEAVMEYATGIFEAVMEGKPDDSDELD
jgi:hypothetical protein